MGREDSPFVYGDYWLDKRRDGKAADTWQITSYDQKTRQVRYRSTRTGSLDEARDLIRAHEERQRAKGAQRPEDALVIPLLFNYWDEHGREVDSAAQVASSIRQFIGFLMQDEATDAVTVAELSPMLFTRFRRWRMAPHSYDVPWAGRSIAFSSKGVSGEAVQRNLDDIRAALHHQANNQRLPYKPLVPSVPRQYRSRPRDVTLTTTELGAIIGYSAYDIGSLRWILLLIATAVRPDAALAMEPAKQHKGNADVIDLHPPAWARTKKHNPVVPLIPEFKPWLLAWKAHPHPPVRSRKIAWRTMRRELGLAANVVPKTIRHSIATRLRAKGVRPEEIEVLLGHRVFKRTTEVYAKYDPEYLQGAKAALSTIWAECCTAAKEWLAVHMLSTGQFEKTKVLAINGGNASV
jgi:integrase